MSKIEEAKEILKELGLLKAQQNEISALTLLALCALKENDNWKDAKKSSLKITKGIMAFVNKEYNKSYAPNTRETFHRQVLHQLVQARIIDYNPDNPSLPVNSPNAHYSLTDEALKIIKTFGTKKWKKELEDFRAKRSDLTEKYTKSRNKLLIPVKLSTGEILNLSAGKHNEVQAAIVHEFIPRFIKDGIIVYIGDTANKNLCQ